MSNERYSRQVILNGFGEAAQGKLSKAKVLMIGAGGLGCPIVQYLAAAGVGTIGIADDDVVSLSNLHRQVLYSPMEIGQLKAERARARLLEMNPEITVIAHSLSIQTDNCIPILEQYDWVVDGTDNFESRYLINDACALLNKPLVFAAVSGFEGQLAVFNVPDKNNIATNYRDIFPIPPSAGEIPNCAENGVLGVLPGIIGCMAAVEIIKLITGIGTPLLNKLLHYNALTHAQYEMQIHPGNDYQLPRSVADLVKVYPDSPVVIHGYLEIDGPELLNLQHHTAPLIIDVREPGEKPELDRATITNVPMSDFGSFLEKEIAEQDIVFICQHGVRSQTAARALVDKYGSTKNIYSLKGGIVKWRNYFAT